MAGIGLKDGVDLHNGPLRSGYKIIVINILNSTFFWIQHNLIRPSHECERGCAVFVEHVDDFFLSLNILEKVVLDFMKKFLFCCSYFADKSPFGARSF